MRTFRPLLQFGIAAILLAFAMRLPAPEGGLWRRGYIANLPMPTAAAWNAPRYGLPSVSSPNPEGVGAYLSTFIPDQEVPRALDALATLGGSWARTEIPWAGVEPRRGVPHWKTWDRVVDGLNGRGYRVLGMLCYWNSWVEPYSDEAIELFGAYCERVARRYRGRVAVWEVWNEPNDRTYWKSTPERYVRLLEAAYRGVKRAAPEARVLGGSLSGSDLYYLRTLLDLGAGRFMDGLSVHPYLFGWPPEDVAVHRELRSLSAAMAAAGRPHGLWLTEVGVPTLDEQKQAEWLERYVVLVAQSRVVEAWCWFCLYAPDLPNYSLYRAGWVPRPSAAVLQRVMQRLRGARALGSVFPADLTAPWGSGSPYAASPAQAWLFETPAGVQRVAWAHGGPVAAPVLGTGRGEAPVLTGRPRWDPAPGGLSP